MVKKTLHNCKELAKKRNGKCLSEEYIGALHIMKWQCEYGHVWDTRYSDIQQGSWCPYCSRKIKHTIEYCKKIAKEKNGECLSDEYIDRNSLMKWKCYDCNNIWKTNFSSVLAGSWCKKCSSKNAGVKKRKYTIESCKKTASEREGYFLSKEYSIVDKKYKWQCKNGHIWNASYSSILAGFWCTKCNKGREKKHSIESCKKTARDKGGNCLSDNYINNMSKIKWQCKEGHIWFTSYNSILRGSWCAECSGLKRYTIEDCKKTAKKRGGDCLSVEYKNKNTKYKWKCSCGFIWRATYGAIKNSKHWCPECSKIKASIKKRKYTIEDCKKTASKKGGIFLSEEYTIANLRYKWQCKNEHIWFTTYSDILKGTWCRKCKKSDSQSKIEKLLKLMFSEKTESDCRGFDWLRNPDTNTNLEVDIWIPKLKIAIEYDGEHHFKPICFGGMSKQKAVVNFKKQIMRDKLKDTLMKEAIKNDYVSYFVRISYMEDLTEKNIKRILNEVGIIL